MRVMHIGLACKNEHDADRFFGGLLGLAKQQRKTIPVSITKPLFGLSSPLPAVNYIGNGLHVEVFLTSAADAPADRLSHICLEVENIGALLDRAAELGLAVTRLPKDDGWVVFIDDSDGHRFEIKEGVAEKNNP